MKFTRKSAKLLSGAVIFTLLIFLVLPFVLNTKKTGATDDWWNTDYLKRAKINVTATRENLPAGTPVQISFDSHYLISAEVPSNQKMRSDGKDVRIVYESGSTLTEIDRDIASTSWNETDATVFFATQAEIAFSASSNDYWLYYDHDDESTSPLSSKTNIYGSHTKSYIPVSDRAISNRVADTITAGSNALSDTYVQKGLNGNGDMAFNNSGISNTASRQHVVMSSLTDLGATEGTVEFWVKDIDDSDRESVLWSEAGCTDALGRGCYANYRTSKIHWNVKMSDASSVKIDQTAADTDSPYVNTWRYMAFTWKRVGDTGGEAKVYRDGVIIAEQSWASNYISFPQDTGNMRLPGMNSYDFLGGFDEFRSSDYAKEPADFVDYTYNAEIENNFYGDRAMMEVANANYEIEGSGISTVNDYWFADIDDEYFYALAKDRVEVTDRNTGAVGPFLTKQRKSDLSVVYYFDVGAYAFAKGVTSGPVAFTADATSSPPRLMVTLRDSGRCVDDGEITQFIDTGSAFEFEYAYEHDDSGVSPYNKLSWAQYLKYNSFDHNFYVSFWDGDRTCVGGLLTGAGTSKRPGVAKINPTTHSIEYLQLYELTDITATTLDDGLVNMDIDENGTYLYVARYNRTASADGAFYKIDLNTFTQVEKEPGINWFGTQVRGVGITKLVGEDAVLADGRLAGRELGKFSTIDGSLISGVDSPSGYGNFTGSAHLLMPVSKKAVLLSGGGGTSFIGLAWITDTNTWTTDPIAYDVKSRGDAHDDSLLMGSDGYMYLPPGQDNLITKFSPGISSTYSTVTPSSTSVPADGTTPLTFSVNLKSLENKSTLPENLSVKVVPSNTEGLTLTESTGYQMEQGFSGSTDVNGDATVSLTSTKTQKVNFTVYAEGIELDQVEVNFTGPTGVISKTYDFSNPADYTYNSDLVSLADSKARRDPEFVIAVGWRNRQEIIVNHTLVSGTTEDHQTNFPVLVQINDQSNQVFAKAQADGDDIFFTSSDGTTKISHELTRFTTAEGSKELIAWVKIPTLSATADTNIYMYYGNSGIADQSNPVDVWSGYTGVWHMDEDSWTADAVGQVINSATNNYHGTVRDGTSGTSPTSLLTSGCESGNCGNFVYSGTGTCARIETTVAPMPTTASTLSGWINVTTSSNWNSIAAQEGYYNRIGANNLRNAFAYFGSTGSANNPKIVGATGHSTGTWFYVTSTSDGTDLKVYQNGNLDGTFTPTTTMSRSDVGFFFAASSAASASHCLLGKLDEIKQSTIAHSADWIKTEYNNMTNQATFVSAEPEQVLDVPESSSTVIPNEGVPFYSLVNFSEATTDFTSNGDVKYQISGDNGTTWYWWNGSSWVATTGGYTEANTDDEINAHIGTFSDGTEQGIFKWKMIYLIDYVTYPSINSVTVSYSNTAPLTPTPVSSSTVTPVSATTTITTTPTTTSTSSPSNISSSAIKDNVITDNKTSDYTFVLGVNSISRDDPATREDTDFTIDNIYDIYDQLPIFRGITYPNSDITIEITSSTGEKITGKTTSDNDGYWQYQPAERLTAGEYTIVATVENKDKGINFTSDIYRFNIIDNLKASTPALDTTAQNKKVTGLKAGVAFWIYLISILALIALIIFLVLKRMKKTASKSVF